MASPSSTPHHTTSSSKHAKTARFKISSSAGSNILIYDVEVTNDDECVTVKSPADHLLIESVHCNIAGGNAIGSLQPNTDISYVHYCNIYSNQAGGLYINSYGGSGTLSACLFENSVLRKSPNTGQQCLLEQENFRDTNEKSARPVVRYECPAEVPCYDTTLGDIYLWTEDGDAVTWSCSSA
ncbi:uncharacterized protein LDX57_001782 [Aspergillus melleus]|uniref:uncharacterized protein n=1 Tax=Aspergillus melleus TaxID=138277 RepID=UPI001E8D0B50|nr:uncharacterized protein LDX57_001782 [Aspergillus melleus]KAH8424027.1 hypothetical protein LDX57_001782 [Aspergillus melleus]